MNLQGKTLTQLRAMLQEVKSAGMGMKDIILVFAIEDEIARRIS